MATIASPSVLFPAVQSTVNGANRGDTVTVPSGSANWGTNTLTLSRGISLMGAGRDSTFITGTGTMIAINPDSTAIANEETIRVERFTFDGSDTAPNPVTSQGAGSNATKAFKNLAFGNNRIRNTGTVTSGSGAIRINGQVRGAIFNNIFDRCNVIVKALGNNDSTSGNPHGSAEWENPAFGASIAFGTADNLYFENNTIQWSSGGSWQDPGWIESGQGGRIAVRYNTWSGANANVSELWDIHGFQNWPSNGQTGTMVAEYYGNTAIGCPSFRIASHRGSRGLFFNNILTGTSVNTLHASQYGTTDTGGSGCTAQIPGSAGVYIPEINGTYVFNNQVGSNIVSMTLNGALPQHCGITENVNWWNYNPSFGNGSNGIGAGSATPITTGNPNGAGYWKCSTSTPTATPGIVQTGHLYKRMGGVWVDFYTPFTYPHPLAGGVLPSYPSVSITSPLDGSVYQSGTSVNISVDASDQQTTPQSVTQVDFYVDGVLSGTDNNSPYSRSVTLT